MAHTKRRAGGRICNPLANISQNEDTPVEFKRIGTCTELTAPLADVDEPAGVKLTVVGQGNPFFSGYYPACHSVLGFHDRMEDVSPGARVSYLVTGWFSTAADDPLYTAAWRMGTIAPDDEERFRKQHNLPGGTPLSPKQRAQMLSALRDAWLTERQWTDFDPNDESPSRLLCHGLVRGIIWQPSGAAHAPEVFPLNTDVYRVAIGNTGGEALAALLKPGEEVDQDLLTALQEDLLDQPVTAEVLHYELHSRRFTGIRGGTTYSIQLQGDQSQSTNADQSALTSGRQSPVIPRPLRDLLDQLNQTQSRCDALSRCVEDCRWQVYALWYLWTSECQKGEDADKIQQLESQLDTFKEILRKVKTALDAARKDRDALYTPKEAPDVSTGKIIDELAKYPKTKPDGSPRLNGTEKPELQYRLLASAALPFYRPSEPVIAVDGPAMARLHTAEPSGPLACRHSKQVVAGITLQPLGGGSFDILGEALLAKLFHQGVLQISGHNPSIPAW